MSTQLQPQELRAPTDTFAVRLIIARHHCGDLSQVEAAARCGLKASTWATWEAGAKPRDQAEVVSRISRGLNLPREWLAWGGPLRPEHEPSMPGIPLSGSRTTPTLTLVSGESPATPRTQRDHALAISA